MGVPVPKGRLDAGVDGQSINRPVGTRTARTGFPALKRRAILARSLRDNLVGELLLGITSTGSDVVETSIVLNIAALSDGAREVVPAGLDDTAIPP